MHDGGSVASPVQTGDSTPLNIMLTVSIISGASAALLVAGRKEEKIMKRRIISVILAAMLALSPVTASASSAELNTGTDNQIMNAISQGAETLR